MLFEFASPVSGVPDDPYIPRRTPHAVDNTRSAGGIGVAHAHPQGAIKTDEQGELRIVTAFRSGHIEDALRIQEKRVHYSTDRLAPTGF